MRGSELVLVLALAGCNQVLGIDVPTDDGVPAISGTYLIGADLRTNTTLATVIMLTATVSYDREVSQATIVVQPLTTDSHVPTGATSNATIDVVPGDSVTFAGTGVSVLVPIDANPKGVEFSIDGSIDGVFANETTFCGVINGSYTLVASQATASLPSITLGAMKHGSPTAPVDVNCNGDTYAP